MEWRLFGRRRLLKEHRAHGVILRAVLGCDGQDLNLRTMLSDRIASGRQTLLGVLSAKGVNTHNHSVMSV
jgi:hypothetical protein